MNECKRLSIFTHACKKAQGRSNHFSIITKLHLVIVHVQINIDELSYGHHTVVFVEFQVCVQKNVSLFLFFWLFNLVLFPMLL